MAASIMQQSLMARLRLAGLGGCRDRRLGAPDGARPDVVAARRSRARSRSPPGSARAVSRPRRRLAHLIALLVLDDGVAALVTAIESETHLSPHISWGNVASSVVGATVVLSRQRPDVAAMRRRLPSVLGTKHLPTRASSSRAGSSAARAAASTTDSPAEVSAATARWQMT